MNSFDLSSYFPLYIETARKAIATMDINLKQLANQQADITVQTMAKSELYRMTHNLKSQNAFMGYQQTAQYCLLLEKIFKSMKDNNVPLTAENELFIKEAIELLEKNITTIESSKKELDFGAALALVDNFYKTHYENPNN